MNTRPSSAPLPLCRPAAPARTLSLPADYVDRVQASPNPEQKRVITGSESSPFPQSVHERGGYGSAGYGTAWSGDEAAKNVLRTHTTAVSARMLYALANVRGWGGRGGKEEGGRACSTRPLVSVQEVVFWEG